MKFELQSAYKLIVMKRTLLILSAAALILLSGCTSTRKTASAKRESDDIRRKLNEAVVVQAIESQRFIVRFDRFYTRYGGFLDLRPRSNYIIVDGNTAVINAAYMGRQWDVRPIAGINMRGETMSFETVKKASRGMYDITMRVGNGATAFDVYLTIGKNGTANASINSLRIGNARYRGHVIPIGDRVIVPANRELI
jgi:hypothetical protein